MQTKKLSQFRAVFLTVASMMGAGIFIKTKSLNTLSHHSAWPIIILMTVGVVMVISLLLSLSPIITKQDSNGGFLEWTNKYCPRWFDKIVLNFTRFIYQPLSLLIMGTFILQLLKEQYTLDAFTISAFSFLFVLALMIINIISFEFAAKLQLFLLCIVLVTVFTLPIIGFVDMANGKLDATATQDVDIPQATSLNALGPWMILISGFPSVFFMYDGFYNSLTLREKLKDPTKLNRCLVIGFMTVTVLYCYVIFAFKFGSTTGSYADIPTVKETPILSGVFNLAVVSSALLTLNGICLTNIKMLLAAHDKHHFKDVDFVKRTFILNKYIKNQRFCDEIAVWMYLIFKTFVWYMFIGGLAGLVDQFSTAKKDTIIVINEAIADVCSALIFLIIATIILFLVKMIKAKQKDQVVNKWLNVYKYAAYGSSFIIVISCAYTYLNYFVGIFGFMGADQFQCALKLFVTLMFLVISVAPLMKKKIIDTKDSEWHKHLGLDKKGYKITNS